MGSFTWEPLLGNLYLGTLTWEPLLGNLYLETCTWEVLLGNLDLGSFTWEPLLGNLDLGTLTWEPLLGNLHLGTFTWEPLLGNLGGIGFGAAPVCSKTFTMAEDPKASAVGEKTCKWGALPCSIHVHVMKCQLTDGHSSQSIFRRPSEGKPMKEVQ